MFAKHSTNHTKISNDCKITELSSVLAQNFEEKVNKARLKLISMMVLALCKVKSVNYMALACAFDNTASPESSMRRIQHFMADFDFSMRLVSRFIFGILPNKENLILVMDRTNRKLGDKKHKRTDTWRLLQKNGYFIDFQDAGQTRKFLHGRKDWFDRQVYGLVRSGKNRLSVGGQRVYRA